MFAQAGRWIAMADNVMGGAIPDCANWVAKEKPEVVLEQLRKNLR